MVVFDPDLDIALLHVPDLDLAPLPLLAGEARRGGAGARPRVSRAADPSRASRRGDQGGDRAGRPQHLRRGSGAAPAYLRDAGGIHRGNSGGPFVLPSGRVAGVVFANSVVADGVGYAIVSTTGGAEASRRVGDEEPARRDRIVHGLRSRQLLDQIEAGRADPGPQDAPSIPGIRQAEPRRLSNASRVGPAARDAHGDTRGPERVEELLHGRHERQADVLMQPVLQRIGDTGRDRRVSGLAPSALRAPR